MHQAIRCFLAFDIENITVLRKIIEIQKLLFNTGALIKFVKPENIHITMKFFGSISPKLIKTITKELQKIEFNSFQAKLNGLGVFPRITHPLIVWIGITQGSDNLSKIFKQIDPVLSNLGFKRDFKGFSPHITIARIKTQKNITNLVDLIKNKSEYNFGEIQINSLKLKKSELTPNGPIYTTINQFKSRNEA